MALEQSPDPRAARELLLMKAAEHIRKQPTLPADPMNFSKPWALAKREDAAVELPQYHCAFKECSWVGQDDHDRYTHVMHKHLDVLNPIANSLSPGFPREIRLISAYNEVIAEAVRQGAPYSSYSIHRRCID
eukprot:8835022-Karenia_brevis.AAC.1